MGKASRLRGRRQQRVPGMPDYPYTDAFTQDEIQEVLERKDFLMRFFRDAMKPDGTILGIDDASLQLLVLHAALAGITWDEKLALIRPKVLPDEEGRLVDSVEWIPVRFDTAKARREDAEEEARRRKAAMDVQMAQMTPAAREAFHRMFKPVAEQAFTLGAQHEAQRMDAASDETKEAKALREQAQRLREEGKL